MDRNDACLAYAYSPENGAGDSTCSRENSSLAECTDLRPMEAFSAASSCCAASRRMAFSAESGSDSPASTETESVCTENGVAPSFVTAPRTSSSVVARFSAGAGTGPETLTVTPRAARDKDASSPARTAHATSQGILRPSLRPAVTSFSAFSVAALSSSVRIPRIVTPVTPRK